MDRILDYIVEILFAVYGINFLFRTPSFDSKNGFSNRVAKRGEEQWNYVQKLAGKVFLIIAAVLLAVNLVTEQMFGLETDLHFWVNMAVEVLAIAGFIPIVNTISKRKFPE